jgi:anaerobic selenocysteine-containing dehydrogenase
VCADLPRLESWLREGDAPGLRLVNRRDLRSMNSWLHNLPSLARGRDRCTLQIHPEDAAERGLVAGGEALVQSGVGAIRVPVELSEDVMRGVVSLPHGFGHAGPGVELRIATRRPGANVNAVTDDALSDAPSGASMLFGGSVEVEAVPARPLGPASPGTPGRHGPLRGAC